MPDEQRRTPGQTDISLIKKLLDKGEYLKAYDLFVLDGTEVKDCQLLKLKSMVLSRLGMYENAINILKEVECSATGDDWELLAHLGSLHKKQWLMIRRTDRIKSEELLHKSLFCYEKARELGGDFWCAVNVATLAKIIGDPKKATDYSLQVTEECWDAYRRNLTSSSFWVPAALGEAYLVREEFASTIKWYNAARSHVAGNLGWLQSARSNAKLLIEAINPDSETANRVLDALPRMRIALFAGHRLDENGRASVRFPKEISEKVKLKIRKELSRLRLDWGIASAAVGADILFQESMQEMGKRTAVVLPYQQDCFRQQLVSSAGEDWGKRFDAVVAGSDSVEISSLGRFTYSQEFIHCFCSDFLLASAVDMALVNDAELLPIVLWDGKNSTKRGGTADTVAKLLALDLEPGWIKLTDLYSPAKQVGKLTQAPTADVKTSTVYPSCPRVKPLLVVYTSQPAASEEERVNGISELYGTIERIIESKDTEVLRSGAFPNGMYLIFDRMEKAWDFVRSLLAAPDQTKDCSVFLHAGVLVNLPTSISGTRDFYCREVEEALIVCSNVARPFRLCTMQARALSGRMNRISNTFHYQGRYVFNDGGSLKLYEFLG